MAKKVGKVYLGYEDEVVTDKTVSSLSYTANKIGGQPDWPPLENIKFSTKCPLCGLYRLLIVQCYAPLENSSYHRTLYVFACVNPACWNHSESWICVRSQYKDNSTSSGACSTIDVSCSEANPMWCDGADEWDENDNGDTANGNVPILDNILNPNNGIQRFSDEDEESSSFEVDSVEQALESLQVCDAHNANMSPVQGAVGAIGAPVPDAELEGGDEPGLVSVDTPTAPSNDLQALLHQTPELPSDVRTHLLTGPLQFVPKYMYVEEEIIAGNYYPGDDFLNKYCQNADMDMRVGTPVGGAVADEEAYEKDAPRHGDAMFHTFLTRLRSHPGQILRYSRDEQPILGAPLPNVANTPDGGKMSSSCPRCFSKLICEVQMLPAFTSTLQLPPEHSSLTHLHFLSVLIFTCSESCWEAKDTLVKETVIFQPEI